MTLIFVFKVRDTITAAATSQKKSFVVVPLLTGILSTLASFTFGRITAAVGTTLTLENGSNDVVPIVLEEPR